MSHTIGPSVMPVGAARLRAIVEAMAALPIPVVLLEPGTKSLA